jgi:hypothetical protein
VLVVEVAQSPLFLMVSPAFLYIHASASVWLTPRNDAFSFRL